MGGDCYELNVCIPLTLVHKLKPNPQCDSIWRQGLWKVMRSKGWSTHDGISALIRRNRRELASVLCGPSVDTDRRHCL